MNKRYYEHTLSTTREFIEYLHRIVMVAVKFYPPVEKEETPEKPAKPAKKGKK